MPANESSLRVILWGDLIVNLFIKTVFFTNIRNDYSLKMKRITLNYASTTNQIKVKKSFLKKVKFLHPLKR